VAIQALMEDYLENIVDRVKEVINDYFERAAQKQEDMHSNVQVRIVALQQILETTRIEPVRIGEKE
jgi:hypothetical protein